MSIKIKMTEGLAEDIFTILFEEKIVKNNTVETRLVKEIRNLTELELFETAFDNGIASREVSKAIRCMVETGDNVSTFGFLGTFICSYSDEVQQ